MLAVNGVITKRKQSYTSLLPIFSASASAMNVEKIFLRYHATLKFKSCIKQVLTSRLLIEDNSSICAHRLPETAINRAA